MVLFSTGIRRLCSAPEEKYSYCRLLFIIVLGVLAYYNTFSVPFILDDTANLQNNPIITEFSFSGIKKAFWSRRAIGIISFQLNYYFTGLSLFWFHLTNLTIHISAALIAYQLVKMLLKTPYAIRCADEEFRQPTLPFFTALFFAVHPVQTQAVTYIVQRFSSLATLFYLVSVVAYIKYRISQVESGRMLSSRSLMWASASLGSSFLAFYTKEIAYTLPAAIVLVELLFFRCSLKKIIFLAVGGITALAAVLTKFALSAGSINNAFSVLDEATRLQTGSLITRTDYLLTQFMVVFRYICLIMFPFNQRVEYDYPLLRSFSDWRVFCSFGVIILLLGGAAWMIIKSRDAFPEVRFIAFGILWFFLGLSVESSFIPIIDLIFEHRLYLPSFGAFTALSTAMLMTTKGRGINIKNRLFEGILLVVVVLAIVTYQRNSVWRSEVSLWVDNVAKSPESARAWHHLGVAYISNREPLNSLSATVRSIELDRSRAAAWNNLGIALDIMGVYNDRFHRTSEMFSEPESITAKNINSWQGEVNNNLGLAYEILGNLPKAIENYRNAVGYNPALSIAYYNLGIASASIGDFAQYSGQLQILMMLDPALADRLLMRTEKR